jgi:contactin associated protein-like 2
MGSYRSTVAEKIRVGFTTTNPKGFLLGLFSNISGEYMTIAVSNSGKYYHSVKVFLGTYTFFPS